MNKYEKIIDALRKFPKKSNKEIAARIGVSASYVYKVKRERGNTGYTVTTNYNNDAVGPDATSNGLSWELPD